MTGFNLLPGDRRVSIQISVSNPDLISDTIRMWNFYRGREAKESDGRAFTRKQNLNGEKVLEETEEVFAFPIIRSLLAQGFSLGGVIYSERQGGQTKDKTYYMVRFVFFAPGAGNPVPYFAKYRDEFMAELETLLKEAFWRVRAFRNPLHDDEGNELPGLPAVSLNLEARVPRIQPDGKPVLQWRKDERGEKIGDKPVQIEPKFVLGIRPGGHAVELFPYSRS